MSEYFPNKPQNWMTRIQTTELHRNPWFKLREDRLSNNSTFYVVECDPSVFIVPFNDDGHVTLIEMFRYLSGRSGREVPAGSVELDESLEDAAHRELLEETGLCAEKLVSVGSDVDSMNGVCEATMTVFIAEGLKQTQEHEKEEEGITDVQAYDRLTIFKMMNSGVIVDALSIAARAKAYAKLDAN